MGDAADAHEGADRKEQGIAGQKRHNDQAGFQEQNEGNQTDAPAPVIVQHGHEGLIIVKPAKQRGKIHK